MNNEQTIHISPPPMIVKAGAVALSLLALFLAFEAIGSARSLSVPEMPVNTITVSGTGKASLAPDIAKISFGVTHTASTVAVAQAKATEQSNAALAWLKEQKIADKDIKTTSYSITPQYSYPNPCRGGEVCPMYYENSPKITGYQVSQSIEVKVRDLDKVGDILAGLGGLEVQNLYGPNLTLDNPTAGQDAARDEAIQDAKTQAGVLAKQLGVRLGRIVSFNESGGGYPYPMAYGMGGAEMVRKDASAPSIPTGENEYTSTVSITYEIR